MDGDGIGRAPGPAKPAAPRGGCAIAAVRGDVTTARAASLVWARVRQRDEGEHGEGERGPDRASDRLQRGSDPDAFLAHLLRAGPA